MKVPIKYIVFGKYPNNVQCHYCQTSAVLIDSAFIYGKSYGNVWYCDGCGAYVGCHKNTYAPLGIVANGDLRRLKMKAHKKFDRLWKEEGFTRSQAYNWLSQMLNLPKKQCHIGMFDIDMCIKVLEVLK